MPVPKRKPTMIDALQTALEFGVEVNTVLDVGILTGTPALQTVFPDIKHHLFEPMDIYYSEINKNYKDMDYVLHNVAVSDVDGDAWQVHISKDTSGKITHSYLSDRPKTEIDDPNIVDCKTIKKATLDSCMEGIQCKEPFLLKLDVDGHEMLILRGAPYTLSKSSLVVIEATVNNLIERAGFMVRNGFVLFDIVDLAYYAGALWQVDLIFVKSELVQENDRLNPLPKAKKLDWSLWYTLTPNHFGE